MPVGRVPIRFSAVFDMDGVIVDNRVYHTRAWEAFSKEHGLAFDLAYFRDHLFGRVNRDILRGLFKRELPRDVAAAYGVEKEALYRKLYKGHVEPAAGLVRLIRGLRSEGVTTAVATAAPRENLDLVLDEAGLRACFDALIDISAVRNGKPAPDLYLKAAEALGMPPERCVAFEDSHPGIASALAAGMRVVGITTAHKPEDLGRVHLVIGSFDEISVERLRALLAAGRPQDNS
jgi:HAD superfamily hydrolase (TIGR01509 family)